MLYINSLSEMLSSISLHSYFQAAKPLLLHYISLVLLPVNEWCLNKLLLLLLLLLIACTEGRRVGSEDAGF